MSESFKSATPSRDHDRFVESDSTAGVLKVCNACPLPGSLEHYVGNTWAREQMKTGALFDAPTQLAITAALLELMKEYGGELEGLRVELVTQLSVLHF